MGGGVTAVHTHFYEFPEFPYPEEYKLADTDLPDGQLVGFNSLNFSNHFVQNSHAVYYFLLLLDMFYGTAQIYDYCCAYVEKFNLREKIKFETRFLRLEPPAENGADLYFQALISVIQD